MPSQVTKEKQSRVIMVRVAGKLTNEDYARFIPEFERFSLLHGKLRQLFDLTLFHGWKGGALWEDIKFDFEHSGEIERIAMVGDAQWEEGMAIFCKPFTRAAIRFFKHAQIVEAREWLQAPP